MAQGHMRLGIAAIALIALWVVVYWWTPAPERSTEVAFERPVPVALEPDDRTGQIPPEPKPSSIPEPDIIPPSFIQHTVRAGDTAEKISQRHYNTTVHWQSVMKANPKTDFQHLRVGMTIRVPVDPANVQGIPNPDAGKLPPPKTPPPPGSKPVPPLEVGKGIEYTVERGDTLTGLAARFYGRASAWTILRDANLDKVGEDGSKLRSGMRIVIPPAPNRAAN